MVHTLAKMELITQYLSPTLCIQARGIRLGRGGGGKQVVRDIFKPDSIIEMDKTCT